MYDLKIADFDCVASIRHKLITCRRRYCYNECFTQTLQLCLWTTSLLHLKCLSSLIYYLRQSNTNILTYFKRSSFSFYVLSKTALTGVSHFLRLHLQPRHIPGSCTEYHKCRFHTHQGEDIPIPGVNGKA